jgi:hypothetical protein
MLDLFVPEGVLAEHREKELVTKLTDILLLWEGPDPANEYARSIAYVLVHRPALVFVGGSTATCRATRSSPRCPRASFDDRRRTGLVKEIPEAVLDAEDGAKTGDVFRVWAFTHEAPDGSWGGGGRIFRLADHRGVRAERRRGWQAPCAETSGRLACRGPNPIPGLAN